MRIIFQTIKDIDLKICVARIEDLNEDRFKISRLYLLCLTRKKQSKSPTVGPGRFIDLNDSASPKMGLKMYLKFFQFLFKGSRAV